MQPSFIGELLVPEANLSTYEEVFGDYDVEIKAYERLYRICLAKLQRAFLAILRGNDGDCQAKGIVLYLKRY